MNLGAFFIPSYVVTGERWGDLWQARLTCHCKRDDLLRLIGTKVEGREIVGVESFAVEDQSHRPIGLLLAPRSGAV